MTGAKKKGLSREEATQLYDTLKKRMESKHGKQGLQRMINEERDKRNRGGGGSPLAAIKTAQRAVRNPAAMAAAPTTRKVVHGQKAAILLVVVCAVFKLTLSALEVSGVFKAEPALASMQHINDMRARSSYAQQRYSKEEVRLLKSLDARRVEMESKQKKIEAQELMAKRKDREYAARLTELRSITQKLKDDRIKSDRKRKGQLDQLANVYGSMNPKEAAELIEQLDITIARQLIERMPEKRIAQILSMMTPDRALTITRMLSGS